jgi:LCP family protein required for cell wall assembly
LATGRQRLLFVAALIVFGIACLYTGVFLLGRVSPALFPGRTILNIPGFSQLETIGITENAESSFNRRINLLVMGIDARPGDPWDGVRTDTLMIATIDPLAKTVSMISFPRDMWVDIHPPDGGVYQERINTSFEVGAAAGGDSVDAGAAQLAKDMKLDFGVDTDYYVLFNFQAVEELVDAIGGVDVDIPADLAVPDWFYSNDDVHGQMIHLPAGLNHLDGYHAVALGRSRDGEGGDFFRIKRQQLVVQAALGKIFSAGLLNPTAWPPLWDTYGKLIHTNVPFGKMPGFASLLQSANGTPIKFYSVADPVNGKDTMLPFTTDAGAAVLGWDPAGVQYWINQAFTKAEYSASSVEVRDGYGPGGGDRTAAVGTYLKYTKNLPTVTIGPKEAVQPTTTIVVNRASRMPLATDIANWLKLPSSAIQQANGGVPDSAPDIVITIGQDSMVVG